MVADGSGNFFAYLAQFRSHEAVHSMIALNMFAPSGSYGSSHRQEGSPVVSQSEPFRRPLVFV